MMLRARSTIVCAVLIAMAACGARDEEPSSSAPRWHALTTQPPTIDETFDAPALAPAWSSWDGYALQFPYEIGQHASFGTTGSHLRITIPAGSHEHNQWVGRHAAVVRDFPGSGVYEVKMDGTMFDDHQFGLVFQSAPDTFLQFMVYTYHTGEIYYFAERFANVGGQQHKQTLTPWGPLEGSAPAPGPYYLRVSVDDDAIPAARSWSWAFSRDGIGWTTLMQGVLETNQSGENIGVIGEVGVFAGNQEWLTEDVFVADFDHFRFWSSGEAPIDDPPAQPPTEEPPPPAPIVGEPVMAGLITWLDATQLAAAVVDGQPVTTWLDASTNGNHALAPGAAQGPRLRLGQLGGRATLEFDGVDDVLVLPPGYDDFTAGVTMFVVAQPAQLQSGFKLLALGNGPGVHNVVLGRNGGSDGLQYFTSNASGNVTWFNTGSALTIGQGAVFSVRQAAGAVGSRVDATVMKDGNPIGSGSLWVPPVLIRASNYIGQSHWSEGRFAGHLAELLIYNRALADTELATVESYLESKYFTPPTEPPTPEPPQEEPPAEQPPPQTEEPPVEEPAAEEPPSEEPPSEEPPSEAPEEESSPPVIAPTPISEGLALHLDASAAMGGQGTEVASWIDRSGRGNHAFAATGKAPTVNLTGMGGRPSLSFDGVDDFFTFATGFADFTAGLTLFVVAKPTVLQSGFKLLALGNGPGVHNIVLGRNGSSNGLQYFTDNASGQVKWFNTGAALFAGQASLFVVEQAAGLANGAVPATVKAAGATVGGGNVWVPPVVQRQVNQLGRSFWNEGLFQGDLAEVLLYDRALSAEERALVEAYLNDKYQL